MSSTAPAPVPLLPDIEEALELSGITWLGKDRYALVSDQGGVALIVRIAIDIETGRIQSASLVRRMTLASTSDAEAVAFDPRRRTLFVADEAPEERSAGPICEHSLLNGSIVSTVELPESLSRMRPNLGFESLTYDPVTELFHAALEGPLKGDGPPASPSHGALVRVFTFSPTTGPVAEWAYEVDRTPPDVPLFERETNGVVGLVALPGGRLLVLERGLGAGPPFGLPSFRHRLYVTVLDVASEVSDVEHLQASEITPLPKWRLWEQSYGPAYNFEGITLGPELRDGSRALVLVSDDGSGLARTIHTLRLELAD